MHSSTMVKTDFSLTSSAFANNRKIPRKYTCQGQNISPPFRITGIPEETESLVMIMQDADVSSTDWTHWLAWNIPADTDHITEATLPVGSVEGLNSFGVVGYGGPCPPSGTHHYKFELYALENSLNLSVKTVCSELEAAMDGSVLAKATLSGIFSH